MSDTLKEDTFSELIASKVVSTNQDFGISGALLTAKKKITSRRPDYFYLTDLINPQQAYWDYIGEMPEIPKELKKKFNYGNLMHHRAGYVLSKFQGFSGSEGVLDGAEVGLPGIRGRADFRFGDALVEFKTTKFVVDQPDQIWKNVPQHIEQILFYTSLWKNVIPNHFLIFYTEDEQQPIRVFKIKISDHNIIKNVLRQRRDTFRKALDNKDPTLLKKCRYFEEVCPISKKDLCSCDKLEKWSTKTLQSVVDLERDKEFEKSIFEKWKEMESGQPRLVRPWDLVTPRKTYGWLIGKYKEEPWLQDGDQWIWKALKNSDLLPGPLVTPSLPQIDKPIQFKTSGTFIKRTVTNGMESQEKITPTLIKRWKKDYPPQMKYKGVRAYIIQLGVLCSLSNKSTGVLLLDAQELDNVFSFLIQFKDLNDIKRTVRESLNNIKTAMDESDIKLLPKCPQWMIDMGACENCRLCD
jgi:hypothetical protein